MNKLSEKSDKTKTPITLDANEVLEILKRAVKSELNRKRALGQYAVVSENGEIKKIQY